MSKHTNEIDIAERLIDFGIGGIIGEFFELAQGIRIGYRSRFRPIYGFGAALAYRTGLFIERLVANLFIVIVVEYLGSVIFDRDKRLWDYSNLAGNLDGRICLKFSILFAIAMTLYGYLPKHAKGMYLAGCVSVHASRFLLDRKAITAV